MYTTGPDPQDISDNASHDPIRHNLRLPEVGLIVWSTPQQ